MYSFLTRFIRSVFLNFIQLFKILTTELYKDLIAWCARVFGWKVNKPTFVSSREYQILILRPRACFSRQPKKRWLSHPFIRFVSYFFLLKFVWWWACLVIILGCLALKYGYLVFHYSLHIFFDFGNEFNIPLVQVLEKTTGKAIFYTHPFFKVYLNILLRDLAFRLNPFYFPFAFVSLVFLAGREFFHLGDTGQPYWFKHFLRIYFETYTKTFEPLWKPLVHLYASSKFYTWSSLQKLSQRFGLLVKKTLSLLKQYVPTPRWIFFWLRKHIIFLGLRLKTSKGGLKVRSLYSTLDFYLMSYPLSILSALFQGRFSFKKKFKRYILFRRLLFLRRYIRSLWKQARISAIYAQHFSHEFGFLVWFSSYPKTKISLRSLVLFVWSYEKLFVWKDSHWVVLKRFFFHSMYNFMKLTKPLILSNLRIWFIYLKFSFHRLSSQSFRESLLSEKSLVVQQQVSLYFFALSKFHKELKILRDYSKENMFVLYFSTLCLSRIVGLFTYIFSSLLFFFLS